MRWLDSIIDSMDINLSELQGTVKNRGDLACWSPWGRRESDMTWRLNSNDKRREKRPTHSSGSALISSGKQGPAWVRCPSWFQLATVKGGGQATNRNMSAMVFRCYPEDKEVALRNCVDFLFFSFWLFHVACKLPQPGIKPMPPAVEAWSLNHWTTE